MLSAAIAVRQAGRLTVAVCRLFRIPAAGRSSIEVLGAELLKTQCLEPGDHYRGPAQALGPGATGCVFTLVFCYHAGQSQQYRPGFTGSSVRPGDNGPG